MKRSSILTLIAAVLIIILYLYLRKTKNKSSLIWYPRYEYLSGKMPYDLDVFIELMKKDVGKDSFEQLNASFSDIKNKKEKGLYLSVQSDFYPDSLQTAVLLNYVKEGNTAFISAENFGFEFAYQLFFDQERCLEVDELTSSYEIQSDTCTIFLNDSSMRCDVEILNITNHWTPLMIFKIFCKNDFAKVISRTTEGYVTGVEMKWGRGRILLHSMPVVFTNYTLRKKPVFNHANALINRLDYKYIYWDELLFINGGANEDGNDPWSEDVGESAFKQIFANRSFKTAFFLILFSIIVFVLLASRRKQPAVGIVEPLHNSSIEFSKTMARMYWLYPNHKQIAEKRIKFFLSEIRNRYQIETRVLDDQFLQLFMHKSGVEARHVNRLFNAYKVVLSRETIHEDLLLQISESIVYIRSNWK